MTENVIVDVKTTQSTLKNKGSSLLSRDDFDSGPVSLDLIEEKLWLGNLKAACDVSVLSSKNISHILTIDSVPLPRSMTESSNFTTKYVQVTDIAKEDIISHFDETYKFIKEGIEKGGVLVHCYFGMSRSAAVVIAYMMANHKLSFEEAFYIVKAKRSITCPNNGFIAQLKLYGHMQCKLDKNHPKYRQFRLKLAAENVRKVKILPQSCADLVKPDPGLTRERPDPLVYRCKKCRRILASQSNIIPHIPHDVKLMLRQKSTKKRESKPTSQTKCELTCAQTGEQLIEKLKSLVCSNEDSKMTNSSKNDEHTDTIYKSSSSSDDIDQATELPIRSNGDDLDLNTIADHENLPEVCVQTYFVEPLTWMKDINRNVQGKLHCPKCANKLGSFSWIMGCQCPCGTKVAPAFYLVPSKVERSNVVQNVQVTV